jgi:HD-GYP domain-containing protein (c-di-GMP phosphodiesterase class II)
MAEQRPKEGLTLPQERITRSKGFDEEAVQNGKDLVTHFYVLMKTAQIHDPTNIALENPLENLVNTLKKLWQWNPRIDLHLMGDYLFLDDLRLRMDIERAVSFTAVIEALKQLQVGGIVFHSQLTPDELKKFVYLLVQADPKISAPFDHLKELMRAKGMVGVEVERLEEKKEEFETIQQTVKESAKSTYFKTLTTAAEVMDSIKLGQAVSIKRAKRVVQNMIDLLLMEESTLLGLTTLRCHDLYTHNHSVNVCILSLALGQRLGYEKKKLTELGIAALFHDMGKANIPAEVLNKATEFTEEDWQVMRRHPVQGVKFLLRLKGINETTIRMATGVFEHHLNYDLSGYPKLTNEWRLSLFGRIISIVDCYDALTSSRVYNRIPYPPDKALRFMLLKSGKAFDPVLMKIFVNCIGIFPIGTLVLLNTRELAVVMETHPNPEKADRPKVKIIADPAGNPIDGEIHDLSEIDLKKQRVDKFIVKTVDSTKYKFDISRYFT